MIWSIVQVIGRQGITLSMFALLALLLKPSDFGTLAMAMTWIAFVQLFSDMGFGAALIQRQKVSQRHFSTIFIINIVVGVFLTIIGIILSFPCALFFKNPYVQPIMAVLSFNFIINSFSWTQHAIAQKELRFRHLAIRDISAAITGGIAGIIFALLGFGVWSLVAQSLVSSTINTFLLWFLSKWKPVFREFSFQYVKELWPYSSKIFAFIIFKYFAQNTDKLIIGYFLGNIALGLYTFAYRITFQTTSTFVGAIGNYLFPKFSKIQDDLASIKSSYLFINKSTNSIVTPIIVMFALLSPKLIPAIFGQKWSPAIPLIQILAVLAIICPWISHVGQVMKSLNRPTWLFYWSVLVTVLICIFIGIGTRFGIEGATCGLIIAYIVALPVNFWILSKLIQARPKDILNTFVPSILASLFLGSVLWWILRYNEVLNNLVIIFSMLFTTVLYLAALTIIDRSFIRALFRKIVKMKYTQEV